MLSIRQIEDANESDALHFLNQYEETSQFLINNMKAYGPVLTEHHNSGNFKVVVKDQSIIGVFCLTRRGNLLIQSSEVLPAKLIIEDCETEEHSVRGFIGDWASVEPIYDLYKKQNSNYQPTYFSKEFLYRLELNSDDKSLIHDPRVRFLQESDFEQWVVQSEAYNEELNIPSDLTRDQMRIDFRQKVKERVWWGMFVDGKLLSRSALNSNGDGIGQVGGVFTPKDLRKSGYAKATMLHMLRDCIEVHGHKKSILFTGETDIPAQRLYESIGYERIGDFALILG